MPRKSPIADPQLQAQMIAWLLADGKRQEAIAEQLGLTEPAVTRLKQLAVKEKWLVTKCELSKDQERQVKARLFPLDDVVRDILTEVAKESPKNPFRSENIHLLDSGSAATDEHGHGVRLQRFGSAAAEQLSELLRPKEVAVVGITWGKTIACLIESLAGQHITSTVTPKTVTFIPLSGVLMNDPSIWLSSTSLAARAHQIVNGQSKGALSLGAAPARIPHQFQFSKKPLSKAQIETLREFAHDIRGYRSVFVGERGGKAMVDQLDTIITSVGCDYSGSNDPWLEEMSTREELSPDDLDRAAHGDISGVFLARSEITKTDDQKLKDINSRWMGAKVEHFRKCAENAQKKGTPGVIVVAVGRRKAGIVRECVRQGLVNRLLIDTDLAGAIASQSPDEPKNNPGGQ